MGYKSNKKFTSKNKRKQRSNRKTVSSYPRQIQNATYMPKNRMIRFSGYRSFVVRDEGFNATGALVPLLEIGANNPNKFIHSTQGTWDSNSMGGKGVAVAGLSQWVSPQTPGATNTSSYLNAQALSCKVTVTAVPMPMAGDEDQHQDVIKMCVQNNTRGGNMANKNIDPAFNSEIASQTVGMKTANLYKNPGGTPRGATLSCYYSYKKQNAGLASQAHNYFWDGHDPAEKDFINIAFLPGDSSKYGLTTLGGTRLPDIRVEVKISYIVLLSEPNTAIQNSELNSGLDLPKIPILKVPLSSNTQTLL